jgi:hypothetical protein
VDDGQQPVDEKKLVDEQQLGNGQQPGEINAENVCFFLNFNFF